MTINSGGFDTGYRDKLGSLSVTPKGYEICIHDILFDEIMSNNCVCLRRGIHFIANCCIQLAASSEVVIRILLG